MKRGTPFAVAAVALVAVAGLGAARAEVAGIEVGAGFWASSPDGIIQFGGDDIDLGSDLDLSSETNELVWIDINHPLPFIPDLRLRFNRLDLGASATLGESLEFGDAVFSAEEQVSTSAIFDNYDIALYYGLPLPLVNVDLGLNFKLFDGNVQLRSDTSNVSESADINGVVPMLFLRGGVGLPLGFGVDADLSGFALGENRALDYDLSLSYELDAGFLLEGALGVRVGYRGQEYKLDDLGDLDANVDFDGGYGLLYLRASVF